MTESAISAPVRTLRVGDLVKVRSAAEILATLDERGELDNLPFMPEMLKYCGQQLTVHKVAHKLCNTISGGGMRRMESAVHLANTRCDGAAHGGCQTACSLYWKEAWLEPVGDNEPAGRESGFIELPLLEVNTQKEPGPDGSPRYTCQATELLRAAPVCLPMRDLGQYVTDVRSGNVSAVASFLAFLVALFNRIQALSTRILPQRFWFRGGRRWGFLAGKVKGRTPTASLDLQPGELVRIKSRDEILQTLDEQLHNRGMGFEEEMARFCGTTATVKARVTKCIDEKTGELLRMKNPCIILDGVVCAGVYSMSCPREFVPFWREIWLERV